MGTSRIELSERQKRILSVVIEDYVDGARPVASEGIARQLGFRVSPATVRNELAALEEAGLLMQPHPSAGRTPTDSAYRVYVDSLLRPVPPSDDECSSIRRSYGTQQEARGALQLTCTVLARLTGYASLAFAPRWDEALIRHVEISRVDDRHVLVVVVTSAGAVEHSLVTLEQAPPAGFLRRLTRLVNEEFQGKPIVALSAQGVQRNLRELVASPQLRQQAQRIFEQCALGGEGGRVYLSGTAQMAQEREFQDPAKLRGVLKWLDEESAIQQLATRAASDEVTVFIGEEAPHAELRECAVVSVGYAVRPGQSGMIGIIGPKRMQYGRAVAAVGFVARSLGEALSRLNVS
jgi:heat-inducible transcriptional repressor